MRLFKLYHRTTSCQWYCGMPMLCIYNLSGCSLTVCVIYLCMVTGNPVHCTIYTCTMLFFFGFWSLKSDYCMDFVWFIYYYMWPGKYCLRTLVPNVHWYMYTPTVSHNNRSVLKEGCIREQVNSQWNTNHICHEFCPHGFSEKVYR